MASRRKAAAVPVFEHGTLPLSALTLAEYNPRRMGKDELGRLVKSLREFGFVEPVVVRAEDRLVIGGHQRLAALRVLLEEQGAAVDSYEVPVALVAGLDEPRTKALNLALNRISGEWDYGRLAAVFQSIRDMPAVDLTGFTRAEVEDVVTMVGQAAIPEVQLDPDVLLAARARHFRFDVATDEEAAEVTAALRAHGMTGPKNAGTALVALVRAATARG